MKPIRLFASVLAFAVFLAGCSIPNLEPADCTDARNVVREFYSFHFGNDMAFSNENLMLRKRFLSPEFVARLSETPQTFDPFTQTSDTPKAFRVGECKVVEAGKRTNFEILLFWKDDKRSEQQSIHADAVKVNDAWLVDNVTK